MIDTKLFDKVEDSSNSDAPHDGNEKEVMGEIVRNSQMQIRLQFF